MILDLGNPFQVGKNLNKLKSQSSYCNNLNCHDDQQPLSKAICIVSHTQRPVSLIFV